MLLKQIFFVYLWLPELPSYADMADPVIKKKSEICPLCYLKTIK